MIRISKISLIFLLPLLLGVGCAKTPGKGSSSKRKPPGQADPAEKTSGLDLVCPSKEGKSYVGFGGVELVAGRTTEIVGEGDRARVKPYSALKGEFQRMFNVLPPSLVKNGDSFDEPPKRWYVEPSVTGTNLFTLYRSAYEAALTYIEMNPDNLEGLGQQVLSTPPHESSANAICQFLAIRAWHRIPSPEEINTCKKVALEETQMEPSVRNRWAYTIATMLAASDFISY